MSHRIEVAIGLDLGGTNIKEGIVANNGQVLYRLSQPTDAQREEKQY